MKKRLLSVSAWAAALLMGFTLTSCVTESDEVPVAAASGDGQLVININSTTVGSETRATSITTDPGNNEKKVNNMLVTIFASDGNSVIAQFERDFTANSASALDISTEQTVVEPLKTSVGTLAAGQKARVACNVSATVLTALKAVTTTAGWDAVENTIDQAFIGADTYANDASKSIDAEALPMYGDADLVAIDGATRAYKIDVTVKHTVAKVTLKSVKLNVSGSQSLEITRVFMINVAEKFNWNPATPFYATNTNFYQGNAAADATDSESQNVPTKQYRDYLTSATISETLNGTNTDFSSTYYFYAMPNTSAATVDTRLVIEGVWKANSEDTNTDKCYYSLKLQNKPTASQYGVPQLGIKPNHNYVINVIIQRAGGDDPYSDQLAGSYQADITPSVADDWDESETEVTFNEAGNE